MLDTVVISGEDVCCSVVFGVVFGTLVGVSVFSVIWSLLMIVLFQFCKFILPVCGVLAQS